MTVESEAARTSTSPPLTRSPHAYFEAKQYPEAIVEFSRAIELNPKASYSWRMRGRSHYFAGEIDAAIADLTAALRVDPGDTWATTWLKQAKRG